VRAAAGVADANAFRLEKPRTILFDEPMGKPSPFRQIDNLYYIYYRVKKVLP